MSILKYPEYFICKPLPHEINSLKIKNDLLKLIQPTQNPSCL